MIRFNHYCLMNCLFSIFLIPCFIIKIKVWLFINFVKLKLKLIKPYFIRKQN